MKQQLRLLFILPCLLCLAFTVRAGGKPRAAPLDSVQDIDEVVVTAYRYREVIPAQQLAGRELDRLSSLSVADAIRYFSGVQIKDYGGVGGLKTVDIRSMGSNHLGVFYDGIEVGNAQNGTVDLGRFSLDFIEEVTLYNGQKSEIFQPAKDFGSAGTIYLRTRRPKFAEGKRTNLAAHLRTGSFDLANPSVLWEQKIGKAVASSFNAEYIYSSGRYRFRSTRYNADGSVANDTAAVRENGDIRSLRVEGGLNGSLEQGSWQVKGYLYDSERGLPGAIVSNVWRNPQRQWDRSFFVQGHLQKQLRRRYSFQLNAKYAHDYLRYRNPDTILMYIDNRFWQQELYLSSANRFAVLPNWDFNLSVDYIWNTLRADMEGFAHPSRSTALAALATALEWRGLKAQASVLGTLVFDEVRRQNAYAPDDRRVLTPAVFLSYAPFEREDFSVRAFYKRIFRMPTFNDLYYTDVGSVNLRPEFTEQYNVGVQYERQLAGAAVSFVKLRADAYYNEVTDKIVATPKGGSGGGSLYRWQMENLGFVKVRGVDASAQVGSQDVLPLHLSFSLNYTYQRAQNFTPPKTETDKLAYGGQINYIPRHSGSALASATWRRWELSYSFIYVGERYHNAANIRENYSPPWYTHDLALGRTFKLKRAECRISAEVNNLLNQAYEVITCYPMPGRSYKLTFKVEV